MKNIPFCLVLFTLFVFLTTPSFSQGGLYVHAGIAIPLGEFNDEAYSYNFPNDGAVGFNLGGKYLFKVTKGGLGLYLGATLNCNGLEASAKLDLKDAFPGAKDITYSKFLNIPVTGGINYTYKAGEWLSLFGELGLGVDFLKITSLKLGPEDEGYGKFNYTAKPNVAFELGGGLLILEKYILELHYCGLGRHVGSYEYENQDGHYDLGDVDIKITLLTIAVGYKF